MAAASLRDVAVKQLWGVVWQLQRVAMQLFVILQCKNLNIQKKYSKNEA
jgi:hypothetical protein